MEQSTIDCDVAIVGGGLSGLAAASILQNADVDFQLFEGASRLGGRIDAIWDESTGDALGDLGPTWVWPPYQPTVSRWIAKLGISTFPQYEQGDAILELEPGKTPDRQFLPGQQGMARIVGGPSAFIQALDKHIPNDRIHTEQQIVRVAPNETGLVLETKTGTTINAQKIICAAPLRLITENIEWSDLLKPDLISVMAATPTWMAVQAKATIIYPLAFWRDEGLSGRIASRIGPMVEVHDHSGTDGTGAALFGFIGLPYDARKSIDLKAAIVDQLVRCFGEKATSFSQLEIRDWYEDDLVCSKLDRQTQPSHPQRLPNLVRSAHCNQRLFFAVAETAEESPGLIDGAFEAGERTARAVLQN